MGSSKLRSWTEKSDAGSGRWSKRYAALEGYRGVVRKRSLGEVVLAEPMAKSFTSDCINLEELEVKNVVGESRRCLCRGRQGQLGLLVPQNLTW